MEKIVKKRFPATTELNNLTFLNDKKVDGELYAYFQSLSKYEDEKTYVLKKDLPKQIDICEVLGIKSPKTYRTHLLYLIEQGYIIEEEDKYILPRVEDIYFLIPLKTLQYLNDNCREHIIKIYIYLGQKYKFGLVKGSQYEFTLEEIGEHIGLKIKNNSRAYSVINNALDLLVNSGLIDYISFFDGQVQKKRLTEFSFDFKSKN